MRAVRTIPLARARRIALGAQGFGRPRPSGRIDARHLRGVLQRLGVIQVDSVNVLTRAHHIPFFSRLGSYDRSRLDDLLWRSGETFEYIGHEAAVMPVDHHPLMRHRMRTGDRWRTFERVRTTMPGFVDEVLAEVAEHGPLTATDLTNGGSRTGPWWGLSPGKWALSALHAVGEVAVADRATNFVIAYDVPHRVLPDEVLTLPTPGEEEVTRELTLRALRAHGIGTAADLADYHRQKAAPVRKVLADLVAEGLVEEVRVDGWRDPAYLDPTAVVPRRVEARALLSPFDPVVWFRPRLERLFAFRYRIEIYVPEPKRVHGYYVLPFLLGDELVARVDLKADRAGGALLVRAAFVEPGRDPADVAQALAAELWDMARWLDLDDVVVEERGDLAVELRQAVGLRT